MDDARNTDENPCGKFGYEILCQNQYIPYIFRGDKKFCATKVIQCHIDKFNVNFNPILNKFPYLTGYEMYEREAFLWNDINIWHNNNKYPIFFRTGDTLMQLSDVCDIFQFIEDCNQKSKLGDRYEMVSGAGLMQIQWTTTENGELMDTVWPYILKGKKRYVPVEFLNGSCTLSSTIVLNGIVIMYMRYLYTVLKREIPKKDEQMVCVELDEALAHSLSNNDHTYHFNENYWPTQKRPALKVPSLPPLLTLENHIKKLNNNNLAFFSKTHTNVDQTKMSSGKVATVTAAAPVISSEKVNDTSENARKVESNTKVINFYWICVVDFQFTDKISAI